MVNYVWGAPLDKIKKSQFAQSFLIRSNTSNSDFVQYYTIWNTNNIILIFFD